MDIAVFQERLWRCQAGVRRADCLRKQQFLDRQSDFAQTLSAWLHRDIARLTLRTINTDQCRNVTADNSDEDVPAACGDVKANCVNNGVFCAADPDGLEGFKGGNGSTVLIEAIRTRCANKVRGAGLF